MATGLVHFVLRSTDFTVKSRTGSGFSFCPETVIPAGSPNFFCTFPRSDNFEDDDGSSAVVELVVTPADVGAVMLLLAAVHPTRQAVIAGTRAR
ncbi:hypothetical protein C1C97_011160 [Kocuria tytonis]|uniref:Uncharacterized protein n=1 Tax=Kocuria tytonis TaxID=2054280 RepID=A0A495A2K2_9MICC|nr:hypothetical protein C1C97_011160 [Kocuria tytonis]